MEAHSKFNYLPMSSSLVSNSMEHSIERRITYRTTDGGRNPRLKIARSKSFFFPCTNKPMCHVRLFVAISIGPVSEKGETIATRVPRDLTARVAFAV